MIRAALTRSVTNLKWALPFLFCSSAAAVSIETGVSEFPMNIPFCGG